MPLRIGSVQRRPAEHRLGGGRHRRSRDLNREADVALCAGDEQRPIVGPATDRGRLKSRTGERTDGLEGRTADGVDLLAPTWEDRCQARSDERRWGKPDREFENDTAKKGGTEPNCMNPRILILGPPGAGKGTQSANLEAEFGVDHITTGDALRNNKQMDISDLDTEYDTPAEYMSRGELVPDAVVNAIVDAALTAAEGFVLDGYPRNEDQAAELGDMTDLDVILVLDVPEAELVDRLTGRRVCDDCGTNFHVEYNRPDQAGVCDECGGELIQRDDDTEATVRDRLSVYRENTEPILDHYADHDGYVEIDGDQSPDAVWGAIREAVETAAAA